MNEKWKAFDLEKLLSDYVGSNETWHKFLDKDTLITGIYILSSGAMDEQLIHKMDEVYLVLEGKATLKIENDTYEARDRYSMLKPISNTNLSISKKRL